MREQSEQKVKQIMPGLWWHEILLVQVAIVDLCFLCMLVAYWHWPHLAIKSKTWRAFFAKKMDTAKDTVSFLWYPQVGRKRQSEEQSERKNEYKSCIQ